MSQTAAERATAFAVQTYTNYEKLKAEAERIYAEFNEAKGEFEWAMSHPALPEGFNPAEVATPAEEEKPAPKRRGRPRKNAEAPVAVAPSTDPVADAMPQSEAPVAAVAQPETFAAPAEAVPVAAPAQPAPAPVATPAPTGDLFDPFAGA